MAQLSDARAIEIGKVLDQKLSGLQVWAIATCAVAAIFDGFDIQSIGILAPSIAQSLHINIARFGTIFSMGWFGVMIGSLAAGPIADRFGRKMPVIVSVFVFGLFTLLIARANTYDEILIFRFLTGLGLGGVLPNILALTSEYAPRRYRGRVMLMMFSGIPAGSVISALLGSVIVPVWGWRAFLYIGALLPIGLGLLLIKMLPESLMFLVAKGRGAKQIVASLRRIAPELNCDESSSFVLSEAPHKGAPVRLLFVEGRASLTLLVWVIYFTNFLVFMFPYSWLASILRQAGLPLSTALVVTSTFALGGIVGMWVNGYFIDKFGVKIPLITCCIGCAVFMAIFGFVARTPSVLTLCLVTFVTGAFINAAQGGNNVITAALYPTSVRSTALGFAFTIGRLGSIISPAVGGMMMAAHWGFPKMFTIAGLPAILGALAVAIIPAVEREHSPLVKTAEV